MPTSIPDWGSLVWSSCGTSTPPPPVESEYRVSETEYRIAEARRAQAQAQESYRRQEESLRQRTLHDIMYDSQGFAPIAKPIKPKDSQEVQELKDQVNHLTDLVESLFKRLESIGILKEET